MCSFRSIPFLKKGLLLCAPQDHFSGIFAEWFLPLCAHLHILNVFFLKYGSLLSLLDFCMFLSVGVAYLSSCKYYSCN